MTVSKIHKELVEQAASRLKFKQGFPTWVAKFDRLWDSYCEDGADHSQLVVLAEFVNDIDLSDISNTAPTTYSAISELQLTFNSFLDDCNRINTFIIFKQNVNELLLRIRHMVDSNQSQFNELQKRILIDKCDDKLVYVLADDEDLINEINTMIGKSGYRVLAVSNTEELENIAKEPAPAALLIKVAIDGSKILHYDNITKIKEHWTINPPVIFISQRSDLEARVAATRAGADSYISLPLNINKLLPLVNRLTEQRSIKPYRALLIDDDELMLESCSDVLQGANIDVKTLSDPAECLNILAEFRPDVIILDYHIPKISGAELVKVIRQDDEWALTSIMFLSGELDVDSQIAAIELGADDFVEKPIHPKRLITLVNNLAKRTSMSNCANQSLKNALRESKYQLATMNEHDIVSVADISGRITDVNEKFCHISGYSHNELIGKNHRVLKSDYHSQDFYKDMWGTISRGEIWHGVICNRNKIGEEYWVDSTIVPFLDENGMPYKYVSARTDITSLWKSEERLHRSQVFANIGTWDWNITNKELYWSDRIGPLFGYDETVPENTYENFLAAVHPDDRQMVVDAITNCVDHGEEYNIEHKVLWPDGSEHWVHESGDVIRSRDGKPLRMLGVVQDITIRKCAELGLAERERQLINAQSLANIGNWQENLVSGEITWSDQIFHILGYEPRSFKPCVDVFRAAVHPDDLNIVDDGEKQAKRKGRHDVVHRIIRPDGVIRHVHELIRAETDTSGELVRLVGTVQDVTERIEMEKELAQQKNMLHMLHQSTTNFVVKGDIRESMNGMLDALLTLTESEYGFSGEVLYDENANPYLKTHAISNIAWDAETQALYDSFKEKGFELRNLNTLFGKVMLDQVSVVSNNPTTDTRSSGIPNGHPEIKSFLGAPIFYGKEFVGMYGIANRPNGYDEALQKLLRPFDTTYGVMIHSKRMTEKEKQIRKVIVDAKVEAENANLAKSQFLSSMSHELRTPMNAIMGFSHLLKTDKVHPLNVNQKGNIDEILGAGNHLLELINEVLDLSKIEAGRINLNIESVLLGEVIAEALQLIMPLAQKRGIVIKIVRDASEIELKDLLLNQSVVRADHTRLRQVLLNLLSNAVKYNNEYGKLEITYQAMENNRIRISVKDTGKGLTEEQQSNLFQAFERMGAEQSEIEGAGIGLLITKNIIELMYGEIGVHSKPGKGSTFWVEIPVDNAYKTQEQNISKTNNAQAKNYREKENKYTILYIEDNPANLRLVTQLLNRIPHMHMWSAPEPLLGLELAVEHNPDLILLDINLPGIDGYEVLKRLRQMDETMNTPIIAVSANAMPNDIEKGLKAGFDKYITKPINVNLLFQSVEDILQKVS